MYIQWKNESNSLNSNERTSTSHKWPTRVKKTWSLVVLICLCQYMIPRQNPLKEWRIVTTRNSLFVDLFFLSLIILPRAKHFRDGVRHTTYEGLLRGEINKLSWKSQIAYLKWGRQQHVCCVYLMRRRQHRFRKLVNMVPGVWFDDDFYIESKFIWQNQFMVITI